MNNSTWQPTLYPSKVFEKRFEAHCDKRSGLVFHRCVTPAGFRSFMITPVVSGRFGIKDPMNSSECHHDMPACFLGEPESPDS